MPAKKVKKSIRLVSYGFMLINAFCWGAALIIVKPAFTDTTPFRFLLYRFSLAAILMLPLLWRYSKTVKQIGKKIRVIVPLEILGTTISLSLLYIGLSQTGAIEASLITTTTPIWVVIGGMIFLREKEEKHELIGLLLAIIGTALLILFPLLTGLSASHSSSSLSLRGNIFVLLSVLSVALYYLLAKRNYGDMPKLFATGISFIVGAASMLPLVIWESTTTGINLISAIQNDLSNLNVLIPAVYMATFGSVIGLTAYIKGQDGIEASEAGLFTYLQPLIYLPLGFILLGEKIFSVQVLALLVILVGVTVAEKRVKNK